MGATQSVNNTKIQKIGGIWVKWNGPIKDLRSNISFGTVLKLTYVFNKMYNHDDPMTDQKLESVSKTRKDLMYKYLSSGKFMKDDVPRMIPDNNFLGLLYEYGIEVKNKEVLGEINLQIISKKAEVQMKKDSFEVSVLVEIKQGKAKDALNISNQDIVNFIGATSAWHHAKSSIPINGKDYYIYDCIKIVKQS